MVVLTILTPLLFHISFVLFCQILQKILLVVGLELQLLQGKEAMLFHLPHF